MGRRLFENKKVGDTMLNEKEFTYLGITKFHQAGYTGRNVVIASRENVIQNTFDDIEAIKFETNHSDFSIHGTNVMDYIRQVAPDARKITAEFSGITKAGILYSEGNDYLQKIIPDILTTSEWGGSDSREPRIKEHKKLYDNGCFLCCCAGNSGYDGTIPMCSGDMWKAIGAARYNNGMPKVTSYSSRGSELDFVSFDNLIATWDNKKHTGTSFASPLFAGMVALVQDFFISKTGAKLSHEKLIEFIKDNCLDLGAEGRDDNYGYGLFILPDPETIEVSKYASVVPIEEVFAYLEKEGELLEPEYWRKQIAKEDKFKWLFIKWANAVRVARYAMDKNFEIIETYNIDDVFESLCNMHLLLEPEYWRTKIMKEDKIKWLFYKWYYATTRRI